MSSSASELKKWYNEHRQEIVEGYFSFLRFPSISTDPSYRKDSLACADYLLHFLQKAGMKAELIPTTHYPLVYAEDLSAGKDHPTVLLYGHYDVQPVDPLDLWKSPPFEPRVEGDEVYARGAQDNKGQIFYSINAVKALLKLQGKLPVNLKICIEGEEESASKGLAEALPKLKEKLKADAILVPDVDIPGKDTPAIMMGLRGLACLEITLIGSTSDLHSGQYGGIAFNPNRALVQLLAQLWDQDGRVTIPHFYDDVQPLTEKEKKEFTFTCDPATYRREWEIEAFGNEKGYNLSEANWIRPTVEINGIGGGYFGQGFKTVIPAKATAKISCRLVSKQDPKKILRSLKKFLEEKVQKGMKVEITEYGTGEAVRGSLESSLSHAVSGAYEEIFQKPCLKIMGGGSVPIVGDMVKILHADVVMMGLGLDADRIHAPNENFSLDRLEKGFLIVARALQKLGEKKHE